MIDQGFRQLVPTLFKPILRIYAYFRVTPNQITLLGCSLGLLSAIFVAQQLFLTAAVIWWLGRFFDGTDGFWARESGQSTAFGAYLDITCDMLAYSAMILGFAHAFPDLLFVWLALLVGYVLCITTALALGHQLELLGISDQSDNRGLRLGAGLAEGGETGIAYTLMLLLPHHVPLIATLWLVLVVLTVLARTALAYKTLEPRFQSDHTGLRLNSKGFAPEAKQHQDSRGYK